jgi:hypothetical protein
MSDVLKVIQNDLKGAADIRAWANQYPWYSVGAAAVAGFAAASVVVPRRGESLEEKLAGLIPESVREQAIAEGTLEDPEHSSHRSGSGILGSMMSPLVEMIKTTLHSAVIAAVTTKATQSANEDSDGSSDDAPANEYQPSAASD